MAALYAGNARSALKYSCAELGTMATRFYTLKNNGRELEDVLSVIQKASAGNPDKETLLSNVAIEIYIDPSITSTEQARSLAIASCGR